jgi:hypothetical protein
MQLAPPIVSCLGIGQLLTLNSVVDVARLVASLYQLIHRSMLLAEVLKVGHDDHHEAKRTAKPTPIAMAVRMSRIVSFMGLLL